MFPILLHLSRIQAQQGLFQCQDLVNHAAGHQVAAGDPSLLLDTVITECVQGGGSVYRVGGMTWSERFISGAQVGGIFMGFLMKACLMADVLSWFV